MTPFETAKTIAVFDVDETLIPFKSMFSFAKYAMQTKLGIAEGEQRYDAFHADLLRNRKLLPRETINRMFYRVFQGWPVSELAEYAEAWWNEVPPKRRWITQSLLALKEHQTAGHPVVLLSGSADFILKPIAHDLGADMTLAITLDETPDGLCDGEIIGIQTIGIGKKLALQQFECFSKADARLIGYGDHDSDLPFLSYCDDAYLVANNTDTVPLWAEKFNILASMK